MPKNLQNTMVVALALYCVVGHAKPVLPFAEKPTYDQTLCTKIAQGARGWQAKMPDERLISKLSEHSPSQQLNGLLSFVGEDVMWWIRLDNVIDIAGVPRAFHEANHTIDIQLARCNGNKATYFFDGKAYSTEIVQGSVPPYAIAAEKIPQDFKNKTSARYVAYFERIPPLPGNDLTVLLDELNAYLTGAQLEVAFGGTTFYADAAKSGKYEFYDGNIQGVVDFMLYFEAYMKAVAEKNPESYVKIKNSSEFIAHVQRLWSASEITLNAASPYTVANGGIYYINSNVLDTIYSENYVVELDKLGIRHALAVKLDKSVK